MCVLQFKPFELLGQANRPRLCGLGHCVTSWGRLIRLAFWS